MLNLLYLYAILINTIPFMKASILFLSLFLCIHSIAQEENRAVMTNLIEYGVSNYDFTQDQNAEAIKLFNILIDTNVIYNYDCYKGNPLVNNKYKYDGAANLNILSNKEVAYSIYPIDTVKRYDDILRSYVIDVLRDDYTKEVFPSFSFSERWEYDTVDFQFYKKVNIISLGTSVFTEENEYMGGLPLLYVKLKEGCLNDTNLMMKDMVCDVFINSAEFGNWSINDNIEASSRYDFFDFIYSEVDNGKINAYQDFEKNTRFYSAEEIKSSSDTLIRMDTISALFDDNGFVTSFCGLPIMGGRNEIGSYHMVRFIEDWYFDVKQQVFIKRVKAIGFLVPEYDYEKEWVIYHVSTPVFWIFFD
jgi:Gliding motility associated protein GldN